jgi:hypothetical protein
MIFKILLMIFKILSSLFKSESDEKSATTSLQANGDGFVYSIQKGNASVSSRLAYSLSPEEGKQLKEIRHAFSRNSAINGALKDVVYLFAVELLGQKNSERRIGDLQKLHNFYHQQLGDKLWYLQSWVSNIYAERGDLKNALNNFPRPKIGGRGGFTTDQLLSLKHALGFDADAADVLSLLGPRLTKWGCDHLEQVAGYIEAELSEQKKKRSRTFLSEWTQGAWSGAYHIYNGCFHATEVPEIKLFGFSTNERIYGFIKILSREAENTAREELGIPRVGEGWLAETELYYRLKESLSGIEVLHHGRPDWLSRQHLDILIPSLGVAIEYQGKQHDQPVKYFGGEEAFKKTQSLDKKKIRLCKQNGVTLLHVRSGYALEMVIQEVHAASKTR